MVPEPDEDFVFGLPEGEASEYQSLVRLHILPLKKIAHLMRHRSRPRAEGLLVPTTD